MEEFTFAPGIMDIYNNYVWNLIVIYLIGQWIMINVESIP